MGGRRLSSFRAGDRSEYLAQYVLSRFSFVIPLPRQEDFGVVDFLCVLTKEEDNLVYPRNAYYVQVKSEEADIILDRNQSKWLSFFMDLPLILCIVNKKESRVKLFSCWHIWCGLFRLPIPTKLTLKLNSALPLEAETVDGDHVTIPIGPPIINATIDDFEENPILYYQILERWLEIDKLNIARRSVGRVYSLGYIEWETNKIPDESTKAKNVYTYGPEYTRIEKDVAPILTALAHNYRHNKQKEKLAAVIGMLKQLKQYLDEHGHKFANEELLIEE